MWTFTNLVPPTPVCICFNNVYLPVAIVMETDVVHHILLWKDPIIKDPIINIPCFTWEVILSGKQCQQSLANIYPTGQSALDMPQALDNIRLQYTCSELLESRTKQPFTKEQCTLSANVNPMYYTCLHVQKWHVFDMTTGTTSCITLPGCWNMSCLMVKGQSSHFVLPSGGRSAFSLCCHQI